MSVAAPELIDAPVAGPVERKITAPEVIIPANDIDVGLTATLNTNGFVAVTLGMGADPITFTREVVESERRGLPAWRFRKEYLRDWDAQSGAPVFDTEWVERQRKYCCDPVWRYDVEPEIGDDGNPVLWRSSGLPKLKLVPSQGGRLKVFISPDWQPPEIPAGSMSVRVAFAMGIDVGEGVGASDSTIQVFVGSTREQAAVFKDNRIQPAELGRIAACIARWYNDALICPMRKMHGITTLRAMLEVGYTRIWRHHQPGGLIEVAAQDLGWKKGEATDDVLFGRWIDAMQFDRVTLHDLETVQQHSQYIYDDMGRVCHQKLKLLPVTARYQHGDLVVGAAAAYRACMDLPRYRQTTPFTIPADSFEGIRRHADRMDARRAHTEEDW
ncbi:MAG TPA: hypothetical protein VM487_07225 [Phycisphaerae bacterium]|nr:hypothetical protein [Phycisphaerae bacterium]